MATATVLAVGNDLNKAYGHTDQKEHQNLMALTAGGVIAYKSAYKATVDVGNLTDGSGETVQITGCTGVILGRTGVTNIIYALDSQDITVTGYVQADGVIELRFQNEGAATVNLASQTIRIITETIVAGT